MHFKQSRRYLFAEWRIPLSSRVDLFVKKQNRRNPLLILEAFDWNLIDSCANLDEATKLLSDSLKRMKHTAPGPDGLPNWMWRDFSHLLAPVITKLFNRSLQEQFVPCHWKLANVTPIPKESP